jgi:RNA polymerase sigma factor (sigma-70 family)
MAAVSLFDILGRLKAAAGTAGPCVPGDADLLRRWATGRDQSAFEVLVWRFGPMVLGVCRRRLNGPDVEDAFQAVFLALALHADRIRSGVSLGGWLHRVAVRVCGHACRRGRPAELTWDVPCDGDPARETLGRELRAVLDEEVSRLPERFRAPFVLCCLQGQTNAEAARALGRPVGTILSQLATARQRLRRRLRRRGLAPAALAGLLVPAAGQAAVGPSLASSTVQTASLFVAQGAGACAAPVVALTQGVLNAMFVAKIKTAAAVLVSVALLGTGGGVCGYRALGPGEARAQQKEGDPSPTEAKLRKELANLQNQLDRMRRQLEAQQQKLREQEDRLQQVRKREEEARTATEPRGARRAPPAGRGMLPGDLARTAPRPGGPGPGARSGSVVPRGETPRSQDRPTGPLAPGAFGRVRGQFRDENVFPGLRAGDNVELLRAQVGVREAYLSAAAQDAKFARARVEHCQTLVKQRVMGQAGFDEARAALAAAEGKVRIREGELKEAMVLLKQAEGRLTKRPAADATEDRLRNVEKKLVDLLDEVRALRGSRPAAGSPPSRR